MKPISAAPASVRREIARADKMEPRAVAARAIRFGWDDLTVEEYTATPERIALARTRLRECIADFHGFTVGTWDGKPLAA